MVGDLLGLDEDDDYLAHASRAAPSRRPPPVEPPGDVALLDESERESERESEEEDLGAALSRAEAAAAAPLSPYRDELPSRRVPPPSSSVETVRDAMEAAAVLHADTMDEAKAVRDDAIEAAAQLHEAAEAALAGSAAGSAAASPLPSPARRAAAAAHPTRRHAAEAEVGAASSDAARQPAKSLQGEAPPGRPTTPRTAAPQLGSPLDTTTRPPAMSREGEGQPQLDAATPRQERRGAEGQRGERGGPVHEAAWYEGGRRAAAPSRPAREEPDGRDDGPDQPSYGRSPGIDGGRPPYGRSPATDGRRAGPTPGRGAHAQGAMPEHMDGAGPGPGYWEGAGYSARGGQWDGYRGGPMPGQWEEPPRPHRSPAEHGGAGQMVVSPPRCDHNGPHADGPGGGGYGGGGGG